jgi:redox-sensitive bicupin YhaK (pirin superfamily)
LILKRSEFLKKPALSSLAAVSAPTILKTSVSADSKTADEQIVGFNHLPLKEHKTMKTVYHPAQSRGNANHGWLNSYHSFSFANYYNPERMNFGALRVLNDDTVAPGQGFGTHPHENMEIISIPLEGDLEHKDSMGSKAIIKEGDVQVMSAGTGVYHSEYNASKQEAVRFLQIWLFPKTKNVTPRYDQITLNTTASKGQFSQILSPNANDAGVWVHQNAWFYLADIAEGETVSQDLQKTGNGFYAFVLNGSGESNGQKLGTRDALGLWESANFSFKAAEKSRVLLMEVPMEFS